MREPDKPGEPDKPSEPGEPIGIRIAWKLPGHKGPEGSDGEMLVPGGSRVADLPVLLGEDARHVLFVRNQRMCDGTEELAEGDSIVILPILEGG